MFRKGLQLVMRDLLISTLLICSLSSAMNDGIFISTVIGW